MIGTKRIVWLFVMMLFIGLVVVHLRTAHMQAVYRLSQLRQQENQLRQQIWQQQLKLSGALESPRQIEEQVRQLKLDIVPPAEAGDDENAP